MKTALSDSDFSRLLDFRTRLRGFIRWTEDNAGAAGLTPAQHQLLLAIRGHASPKPPSVKDVAGYLLDKQHTVTELIDRACDAGLVRRVRDTEDKRVVRLVLTAKGTRKLERLTALHLQEIERLAPALARLAGPS